MTRRARRHRPGALILRRPLTPASLRSACFDLRSKPSPAGGERRIGALPPPASSANFCPIPRQRPRLDPCTPCPPRRCSRDADDDASGCAAAARLRAGGGGRAAHGRADGPILAAHDHRRERRLPPALPEGRDLRGRAHQYRRRHGRRRPPDGRGRPRGRRQGRADDAGGGKDLPLRRRRDERFPCGSPLPRAPASPGCRRSRSCSTEPRFRRRLDAELRRRFEPDPRREHRLRPSRHGRERRDRAASSTAGASAAAAASSSPRTCASTGRSRALLDRPALGGGARAVAAVLHVAPDAEGRLDEARAHLADARCECGASAWDGLLVARFLSFDPQALRADLVRFLARFRGAPMPRSWQS